MFRFRRYRVFVICAAAVLFLLLRAGQNAGWEGAGARVYDTSAPPSEPKSRPEFHPRPPDKVKVGPKKPPPPVEGDDRGAAPGSPPPPPPPKEQPVQIADLKTSLEVKGNFGLPEPTPAAGAHDTSEGGPKKANAGEAPTAAAPAPTQPAAAGAIPPQRVPDREHLRQGDDALHIQKPPGRHEDVPPPLPSSSTIHWHKVPERFPVDSPIPLPTGKPQAIPTIQYGFKEESPVAKEKREGRLARVKAEMGRAWSGYKEFAWGHDEVKPLSKSFNDPFCGWAATLVDSMDTLWIMGMKDEFDDAYGALRDIDFTTTPYRAEIPVFETIIRYLGGLLAAYDVTGGHDGSYPLLLEKAVELAEILMGVFDTPNRMPILYYNWKPTFASQPHRASTNAGVAELGSMTMEFTRLAQLTKDDRFYDVVARIVDAFEEWQNRPGGTAIPGIFPQQVDASGCNRTAQAAKDLASEQAKAQMEKADLSGEPQGYTPASPGGQAAPGKPAAAQKPDLEFTVAPGRTPGEPGTGEFKKIAKRDPAIGDGGGGSGDGDAKYGSTGAKLFPHLVPSAEKHANGPLAAHGELADWDCVPQGLAPGGWGVGSYSMGGSQDSTYEYFPKQYLLLGGLEPKYRAMHEKTVDAATKYLLFRPMIEDESRSLLFSAKVNARDGTDKNLVAEFEVTHLTCFLGGMYALGGKIFDRPEDVDRGARLADGCAWAYEVMPTGVMPEYSNVAPCMDDDDCPFNQTAWYERLDPNADWRLAQMKSYEERMAGWEVDRQKALRDEAERQLAAEQVQRSRPPQDAAAGGQDALKGRDVLVARRDIDFASTEAEMESEVELAVARQSLDDAQIEAKVEALEKELDLNAAQVGHQDSVGGPPARQRPLGAAAGAGATFLPPQPVRPLTHEEYVAHHIESNHLPKGFTSIIDPRYILRPEAIESVWYLYRITGDPAWQEKGWRMFEAVVAATRAGAAHSAVDNVARPDRAPEPTDSMESFWTAETLKYFYLLFAEPGVVSLDEWVLNTEAHPFRRPR